MKKGDILAVASGKGSFNVTFQSEGQCRACSAFMIWAKTEAFRMIPLNARPEKDGTYTSHFATCPKSNEFRRT